VFTLRGDLDIEHAARLEEFLANEANGRVTLDLKDVTLVGRIAVRFLAGAETAGVRIVNCPDRRGESFPAANDAAARRAGAAKMSLPWNTQNDLARRFAQGWSSFSTSSSPTPSTSRSRPSRRTGTSKGRASSRSTSSSTRWWRRSSSTPTTSPSAPSSSEALRERSDRGQHVTPARLRASTRRGALGGPRQVRCLGPSGNRCRDRAGRRWHNFNDLNGRLTYKVRAAGEPLDTRMPTCASTVIWVNFCELPSHSLVTTRERHRTA
jgi:hypothetical protein